MENSTAKLYKYAAALLLLVVGYPFLTFTYNVFFHPLRKYPGPKLFAASIIPIYYFRVRGFGAKVVRNLHDQYGPVVRLAPNELSYIDAQAWKDIFGHRARGKPSFPKDPAQFGPDAPGVQGIIRSDETNHSRQRRIFSHAFSYKALKEQEEMIRRYVRLLIKRLTMVALASNKNPGGKEAQVDMVKLYNFTTFDVMGDLTFGEPLNMLRDGEYVPWVELIFASIKFVSLGHALRRFPMLNKFFLLLIPKSIQQKRKEHFQFTTDKVNRRMATETDNPDIWSLVIKHGGGKEISRGEMYSNASAFMIAGTETTATLLSGVTWFLCKNPDVLQKLTAEIRGLGDADQLTIANLQKLEYLHCCLEEGLRMYPPVPAASMRLVPKGGAIICDKSVPEGVTVGVPHLAAYHSTLNFTEPEKYLPDRWLPNADERFKSDNKDVLQPFSFGPRNCLGKNLAYHEMRLILSSVLYHFDIKLVDEKDIWVDQKNYELWEKKPLYLNLTPASH